MIQNNNNEEITNEQSKLDTYRAICIDALNCLQENHPYQLLEFEKNRIICLMDRMFDAETDYLNESPKDYFEIYNED